MLSRGECGGLDTARHVRFADHSKFGPYSGSGTERGPLDWEQRIGTESADRTPSHQADRAYQSPLYGDLLQGIDAETRLRIERLKEAIREDKLLEEAAAAQKLKLRSRQSSELYSDDYSRMRDLHFRGSTHAPNPEALEQRDQDGGAARRHVERSELPRAEKTNGKSTETVKGGAQIRMEYEAPVPRVRRATEQEKREREQREQEKWEREQMEREQRDEEQDEQRYRQKKERNEPGAERFKVEFLTEKARVVNAPDVQVELIGADGVFKQDWLGNSQTHFAAVKQKTLLINRKLSTYVAATDIGSLKAIKLMTKCPASVSFLRDVSAHVTSMRTGSTWICESEGRERRTNSSERSRHFFNLDESSDDIGGGRNGRKGKTKKATARDATGRLKNAKGDARDRGDLRTGGRDRGDARRDARDRGDANVEEASEVLESPYAVLLVARREEAPPADYFRVRLWSGPDEDSATEAPIYVTLYGKKGVGPRHRVTYDKMKPGDVLECAIKSRPIGTLSRLRLELEKCEGKQDWQLAKVDVEQDGGSLTFPVGGWIGPRTRLGDDVILRPMNQRQLSGKHYASTSSSSNSTRYGVKVVTGLKRNAGTNARVFVELEGERGSTRKVELADRSKDCFEKGQTDSFKLELEDVGQLVALRIGHDNSGLGAGWFLDRVIVRKYFDRREQTMHHSRRQSGIDDHRDDYYQRDGDYEGTGHDRRVSGSREGSFDGRLREGLQNSLELGRSSPERSGLDQDQISRQDGSSPRRSNSMQVRDADGSKRGDDRGRRVRISDNKRDRKSRNYGRNGSPTTDEDDSSSDDSRLVTQETQEDCGKTPFCEEFQFKCRRWLASDEGDGSTDCVLRVTKATTFHKLDDRS